jgi:hypothetical protein
VHEEQSRLLIQHVAMKGRHLDAVSAQRLDDRVNLARHHDEIAGDSGFAAASRLKTDSSCQTHRASRYNRHSVHGDWITPRHTELINATIGLTLGNDWSSCAVSRSMTGGWVGAAGGSKGVLLTASAS